MQNYIEYYRITVPATYLTHLGTSRSPVARVAALGTVAPFGPVAHLAVHGAAMGIANHLLAKAICDMCNGNVTVM